METACLVPLKNHPKRDMAKRFNKAGIEKQLQMRSRHMYRGMNAT